MTAVLPLRLALEVQQDKWKINESGTSKDVVYCRYPTVASILGTLAERRMA